MSPEQARGQSLDRRTDIWSFGCCLFEALTGKPPFLEETVSDTLAAILKNEPDWQLLPPETPIVIRRLLGRSLKKGPRERLHDIGDARIEIEEAGGGSEALPPGGATRPGASTRYIAAIAVSLTLIRK